MLTNKEIHDTCDGFLAVLDNFKITSAEYGDDNYFETEWLEKVWLRIIHGY